MAIQRLDLMFFLGYRLHNFVNVNLFKNFQTFLFQFYSLKLSFLTFPATK